MTALFYAAAAVAILSTLLALTRPNVVHGLVYLVTSLLAVAVVFFAMGAPFVAGLEAIIYAGAIIVLFVFVAMMLGLGDKLTAVERQWLKTMSWTGPLVCCTILAAALVGLAARQPQPHVSGIVPAARVGVALYGPYLVGVELASMLLLGALVGAHHVGRRQRQQEDDKDGRHSDAARADAGGDSLRAGPLGAAGAPQSDVHSDVA